MDEHKERVNQPEGLSPWQIIRYDEGFWKFFEEIGKETNLKTNEAIKDAADIGMSVIKVIRKTGRVPTSEEMGIILKSSKISLLKENETTS
jgi:hypothetical protein